MSKFEESETIWKTIKGSERLYKIYGYFPTFHDAYIVKIETDFGNKQISVKFRYADLIENSEKDSVLTQITMQWSKIGIAEFCIRENDITHLGFANSGDLIETSFESAFGIEGQIIAGEIEVTNVSSEEEFSNEQNVDANSIRLSFSG